MRWEGERDLGPGAAGGAEIPRLDEWLRIEEGCDRRGNSSASFTRPGNEVVEEQGILSVRRSRGERRWPESCGKL